MISRSFLRSAVVVAGAVVATLILALLLPWDLFLAAGNTDVALEFASWRAYLADSLRGGHLPLWNPWTYGGQPFLGGFESAVLYPPNWLFLVLPLGPGINFSIVLHLILLGWGVERWACQRGLDPRAAVVAGIVAPLTGPVFPHVYAGHLSNLCTMAWAPWLFLGLEMWVRTGDRRGLFLASAAVCLQILAGHIQYFFYTAIAAGLQGVVVSIAEPGLRRRALPAVAGCYLAGAALGAAQFWPGLAATTEGVRQQKLDLSFAAMFSFPPENFLTVLAPEFFGSLGQPVYWGRCYLWEMSLFFGVVGPLLIALALTDRLRRRQAGIDLIVAALLLLIALGIHTPLFYPLYDFVPGFGQFRSWSKFIFPAMLFLVMALAAGIDLLLRGERPSRRIAGAGVASGLLLFLAGIALLLWPGAISGLMDIVADSGESYLSVAIFHAPSFLEQAGIHAGLSLILAGVTLSVAGVFLLGVGRSPLLRFAVPAILIAEMVGFAAGQVTVSHLSDAVAPGAKKFIADHPGDYRVLNLDRPNSGFLLGAGDLWGNNPFVLLRYAEFMSFTQGADPDHATQYVSFQKVHPLYALLRFRYAFQPREDGNFDAIEGKAAPLPHVLFVSGWQMPGGRDAIFSAMGQPSFDPAKVALLEAEPDPKPQPGATGSAHLLSATPDVLTIEAETDKPALLLITDNYARDWRAEALPGSGQTAYTIMPADYILRAIPLAAGHHLLRVVYAPASVPAGLAVSAVAWLVWGVLLVCDRTKWMPVSSSRRDDTILAGGKTA